MGEFDGSADSQLAGLSSGASGDISHRCASVLLPWGCVLGKKHPNAREVSRASAPRTSPATSRWTTWFCFSLLEVYLAGVLAIPA